ncbi:MAG: DUF1667 domain-containing protein [Thermodesulfobacteriota bacterium]|nr:DUF1667 domain-containing protein [Thermodesulfobacteriota bacterium]
MKTKELICIVCPNGCQLEADIIEGKEATVTDIRGSRCDKGIPWAEQEIMSPMRTIASNVAVEGGDFPLVSVRTDSPIPLECIMDVMREIKALRLKAPVSIGDHLIKNPAGTTCNIIATRNVNPVK